jgi:hypothetical protein
VPDGHGPRTGIDGQSSSERERLADEIRHWQIAISALSDLELVAAPNAWAGLEMYLSRQVRDRLVGAVRALQLDAARIATGFGSATGTATIRAQLLWLRNRYLQVETILDFYGDAVNTRTNPSLAAVLRGLDVIAVESLAAVLGPLGLPVPPVLVYVDKGLGAAILRAGVRLWDDAHPSPAAAIKITRHNLSHPTALLHETGHQAAHQTGWNGELRDAFASHLRRRSTELAELWSMWATEVAADVYAFCLTGFSPLPALSNVVDGSTKQVFRIVPGDPHPSPWVRVQFNAALCRSWFGPGPWDAISTSWRDRHVHGELKSDDARLAVLSMDAMRDLVDICTRRPMASFGGKPLTALADPRKVSPVALRRFAEHAGETLLRSEFLRRREPLRILAHLTARAPRTVQEAEQQRLELVQWLSSFDPGRASRVA